MKIMGNGRVAVSESDLASFMAAWPCSGLHGLRGVIFEYDRSGNLVDIIYRNGDSDRWDGPAMVALSEDAQEYLGLRTDRLSRRTARDEHARRGHWPWWWPEGWKPKAKRAKEKR